MNSHPSNVILNALPPQLNAFRAMLTAVSLPVGMSIYEAYEMPKFAHFLTSGINQAVHRAAFSKSSLRQFHPDNLQLHATRILPRSMG
jgi:hypothetical protein